MTHSEHTPLVKNIARRWIRECNRTREPPPNQPAQRRVHSARHWDQLFEDTVVKIMECDDDGLIPIIQPLPCEEIEETPLITANDGFKKQLEDWAKELVATLDAAQEAVTLAKSIEDKELRSEMLLEVVDLLAQHDKIQLARHVRDTLFDSASARFRATFSIAKQTRDQTDMFILRTIACDGFGPESLAHAFLQIYGITKNPRDLRAVKNIAACLKGRLAASIWLSIADCTKDTDDFLAATGAARRIANKEERGKTLFNICKRFTIMHRTAPIPVLLKYAILDALRSPTEATQDNNPSD